MVVVSDFVVALDDVGQVRWLQSVELRGLNLDEIAKMGTGVVEVSLRAAGLNRQVAGCVRAQHCGCLCVGLAGASRQHSCSNTACQEARGGPGPRLPCRGDAAWCVQA